MAASSRSVWIHLMLYPTHTLPTAAVPILAGIGLAAHDRVVAPLAALAAFLASWMVHVGGVFLDVHELIARHPGLGEHPELDGAVASGALRVRSVAAATAGWYLAAFVPGLYLATSIGPAAAAGLGAIGVGSASWYAAGGRRSMAALGLAEPVFFLMFGVVAVAATYLVQAAACGAATELPPLALLVGLPGGALTTNVLIIDDLRDVEFDRRKGWRTTAVRFGPRAARIEHLALTIFAYAFPLLLLPGLGMGVLLPLLTLPVAIVVERVVWTAPRREVLIPWTPRSSFLALGYAALLALGLALG